MSERNTCRCVESQPVQGEQGEVCFVCRRPVNKARASHPNSDILDREAVRKELAELRRIVGGALGRIEKLEGRV